jgi:hypothetical protein
MTDVTSSLNPKSTRRPVMVGFLALVWNALGALDYVMTQTRNASYLSSFSAEQLAYFETLPAWSVATWAVGVWGAVLGSILLIFRRQLALPAFAVSLLAAALTFVYNYALTDGLRIMGGASALIVPGLVLLVGILLLHYCYRLSARNLLR